MSPLERSYTTLDHNSPRNTHSYIDITDDMVYAIHYSSFCYDSVNHILFAGAGSARLNSTDGSYPVTYPDVTNMSQFESGPTGKYSVWYLDLEVPGSVWTECTSGTVGPMGMVRDLAIHRDNATGETYVAAAATSSIWAISYLDGVAIPAVWENLALRGFEFLERYSSNCWAVGFGVEGHLYGLGRMKEEQAPWVYRLDIEDPSAYWEWLGDSTTDVIPHSESWDEIILGANPDVDFTVMTVVPGDIDMTGDVVLVGERYSWMPTKEPHLGTSGLYQYKYCEGSWRWRHMIFQAGDESVGWTNLSLAYEGCGFYPNFGIWDVGWLSYYPIYPTVAPLVIKETDPVSILAWMCHYPWKSDDAGLQWHQVFCEGSQQSWSSTGINQMAARAACFDDSGRIIIAGLDFGCFYASDAFNTSFSWMNSNFDDRIGLGMNAYDVEFNNGEVYAVFNGGIVRYNGGCGYDICELNDPSFYPLNTNQYTDILFVNESTMYASCIYDVSADPTDDYPKYQSDIWCYKYEGGSWGWVDPITGTPDVPWIVGLDQRIYTMYSIPNKDVVLAAAGTNADGVHGGLWWLNTLESNPIRILGEADGTGEWASVVNSIAMDESGTVLYVGTNGLDNYSSAPNIGGTVLRCYGAFTAPPAAEDWEVLANQGEDTFDIGTNAYHGASGVWPWLAEFEHARRMTNIAALVVDPNNKDVVYAGMCVNKSHSSNGVWKYDNGFWEQIVGEDNNILESAPNKGVLVLAIDPIRDDRKLYVGTKGEEFYTVQLPEVASEALAKYDDKSTVLSLQYPGTPYSVIAVDYDGDSDEDIIISKQDATQSIYNLNGSQSGVPNMSDVSQVAAPLFYYLLSARSVAVADYNNDNFMDMLVSCPGDPYLFKNVPDGLTRKYDNDSSVLTGMDIYETWHCAWGDVNQDGRNDMYLCRTYMNGYTVPTKNAGELQDKLLVQNESGGFEYYSWEPGEEPAVEANHTASWCDINSDGNLDIFVPASPGGGGSPSLYVAGADCKLSDQYGERFAGIDLGIVQSVTWADVDMDADMDLVLVCYDKPWLQVLLNDGNGYFSEMSQYVAEPSCAVVDAEILDYDLDGLTDILLLPEDDECGVLLLKGVMVGGDVQFVDATLSAGLSGAGAASGVIAIDLCGDGDPELFFGRPQLEGGYYYNAETSNGVEGITENKWVGIRLEKSGAHDASSIGAKVWVRPNDGGDVLEDIISCAQIVDGGSGRGGQQPHVLRFGLGDFQGIPRDLEVVVQWPGGLVGSPHVQRQPLTGINDDLPSIIDSTNPEILSISLGVSVGPGIIHWTVGWETKYNSIDALDFVIVDGPLEDDSETFQAVTADHSVWRQDDGTYYHEMQVSTDCVTGGYEITVISMTEEKLSSDVKRKSVRYCIPEN